MGARFPIHFITAAGMLAALAVNSCGSQRGKGSLETEPDFVGFVTMIDRSGSGEVIGHIAVESHAGKLVHRHLVTLTNRTLLLRREVQATRPVDIGALELKSWVQLWFAAPGKKPYPSEATARQVIIVDRP